MRFWFCSFRSSVSKSRQEKTRQGKEKTGPAQRASYRWLMRAEPGDDLLRSLHCSLCTRFLLSRRRAGGRGINVGLSTAPARSRLSKVVVSSSSYSSTTIDSPATNRAPTPLSTDPAISVGALMPRRPAALAAVAAEAAYAPPSTRALLRSI